MTKQRPPQKPKAQLPPGLRDIEAAELLIQQDIIATIGAQFQKYEYIPLDTSALEYAEAVGQFLPDDDRPNKGVFSFEDGDKQAQWLSLRYDLTAPLARYVAEHYEQLPKPFRRYQWGYVWRNEKPEAGRYRQFFQMDADMVGTTNPAADADICMLAADCMAAVAEKFSLQSDEFCVRISHRKIMDGLLAKVGLNADAADYDERRLTILRAMDKYDRLGLEGVTALLGEGRRDDSGDFTAGAGLEAAAIATISEFISIDNGERAAVLAALQNLIGDNEGIAELATMDKLFCECENDARLVFDTSIVRGLGYYTGAVFEIELTREFKSADGKADEKIVRFGSVGGGGRYGELVQRFKGNRDAPGVGISIGVSRLAAALALETQPTSANASWQLRTTPQVFVAVMDEKYRGELTALTRRLRAAGISTEIYLGSSNIAKQMKYANKRGARCALIYGDDEAAAGAILVKNLEAGLAASAEIDDRTQWLDNKGELTPLDTLPDYLTKTLA